MCESGSGRLVVSSVSAGCDSGRTLEALLELLLSYRYHDLVEHVGQHSVGRIDNKVNETWTRSGDSICFTFRLLLLVGSI